MPPLSKLIRDYQQRVADAAAEIKSAVELSAKAGDIVDSGYVLYYVAGPRRGERDRHNVIGTIR